MIGIQPAWLRSTVILTLFLLASGLILLFLLMIGSVVGRWLLRRLTPP